VLYIEFYLHQQQLLRQRQSPSEVAHQEERPAGQTMAVDNHVKMTQVSPPVELMVAGRHSAEVLYVDELDVVLQRLDTTSKNRKNVIPQYPALAFKPYSDHTV